MVALGARSHKAPYGTRALGVRQLALITLKMG